MRKWQALVCVGSLLLLGTYGRSWYNRIPWIELAAYVHSQRGSTDCGHIVEPDYYAAQAAIACALSANERHQPFRVVFNVHGIDEKFSSAVVGDSKGNVVELFYGTGAVTNANTLFKHTCQLPVQFPVDNVYRIPRLHCAPFRNDAFQRDHLIW